MHKVTLIRISRFTDDNISFTCDSYEHYVSFVKFNFGAHNYMWSHDIPFVEIKSITKIE